MSLEQMEPERPSRGLDEITARAQSEKPPITRPERAGERDEQSGDGARCVANAQAMVGGGRGEGIVDQQPLKLAQRGLSVRPGTPAVEEGGGGGQGPTVEWLYVEAFGIDDHAAVRAPLCADRRYTRVAVVRHVFVTVPAASAVGKSASTSSRRSASARSRSAVKASTVASSK